MTQEHQKQHHEYLKPREAAAYLNSSTSTLAKRRLYGNGPRYHRIGTAIRYRKSDLDQFMALSAVTSTSEEAGQ
jgi:excisionase family DNA binding protein